MADELITRQELIDAKPDVKNLGEAANGNETGVVTPRYGAPYSTAPAAIQKIQNDGATALNSLESAKEEILTQVNNITTVESINDLNTIEKWDGRTVTVSGVGNYKYNSTSQAWERDFITDRQVVTVKSVAELQALESMWDGRTVRTKSYHNGLGKGGGLYIYDSTKSSINNAVTIIKGWVLQYDGRICVTQAGCKLDGSTDDSIAFNNCSALNLPMKYAVSGTLRALSLLNLNTNGLVGTGIFSVIDVVGGHDGIILPLGGGRLFQNIENFRLISSDNSAIDHIAIRSKEATLNSQSLGNGFKIRNIEIGGGGRFGVGIALTDCFRATIEDVGMTSVANAVVLYGQVVQCKLGVITSNNIRDFTTTALNKLGTLSSITRIDKTRRYGLLVCGSSHRENTYLRPESIKSKDNSYVKHDVGLFQHDALYAVYKDIDLDYNAQYAAEFYSCDGLTKLDTAWCANDSGASHGIFIDTSTINPKRLVLKDIHAFAYGTLQANSACIYQNSAASYRRGVTIDGLTLASNFWTNAINFTRSRNFSIKNVVEEGVPISSGVVLNNCRDFDYFDSDVAQSVIALATSKYRVDNISGTVTVNSNGGTYELSTSSEKKYEGKGLTISGSQGFATPLKTNFGYLWMRAGNVLMFKAGTTAPTSETDGVVVSRGLEGSASITAQTIAASSKYTVAVAVAGAATGYPCLASFNQSLNGCSIRAEITAAGTATVTIFNDNTASVALDAGIVTVKVV